MVLDSLRVAVEIFEVVVDGCRWLQLVLGGFRSFHVLVLTDHCVTTSYCGSL